MEKIFTKIKIGSYQEVELDIKISAFEVFKRLYPIYDNLFILESLGEEGKYNRFSYVGCDPELVLTANEKELLIGKIKIKTENPYNLLRQFSRFKSAGNNYCGGLVGFFSYEAAGFFERGFSGFPLQDFPHFQFGLYLDGLKFDKKSRKCIYFHYGKSRLPVFIKFISSESGRLHKFSSKLLKTISENKHQSIVNKAREEIIRGNIFQVVLSGKTDYRIRGDTRRIYAALRQMNPSPYMIYLKFAKREIISASPELLLRIKGKNIEHFGTLAGSGKRSTDIKRDLQLEKNLKSDEKETAEHLMLVDLARNDVGRVARFNSISVERLASVKKFQHVRHLYSEIRGILAQGKNIFDALSACFPAGTLTGAPKIEAMKIIKNLEDAPRGPYGGVAGYFSLNQEAMFAIIIRSFFVSGNSAYTQTGSGIVLDSKPENEYQEILIKQKGLEEAIKKASL